MQELWSGNHIKASSLLKIQLPPHACSVVYSFHELGEREVVVKHRFFPLAKIVANFWTFVTILHSA